MGRHPGLWNEEAVGVLAMAEDWVGRRGRSGGGDRKAPGMGNAQWCGVTAVEELIRRAGDSARRRIAKVEDCLPLLVFLADKPQEHLVCLSLSGAGEVLASRVVAMGLLDSVLVHPREALPIL